MENEKNSPKTPPTQLRNQVSKLNWRFLDTLLDLGLGTSEAKIYELLLEKGPMKASSIAKYLELSRVITYRHLGELENHGVVTKKDPDGAVSLFSPAHPAELARILEQKKARISRAELELQHQLGSMASLYNLAGGKPNVRFLEGVDGVREAVLDSLRAQTEILTIADNEAMNRNYPKLNEINRRERGKRKIYKKLLSLDTSYVRELAKHDNPEVTERRLLPPETNLSIGKQIYDNKISYVTLDRESALAIIIEDPQLAENERKLFMLLWQGAQQAEPLSPSVSE